MGVHVQIRGLVVTRGAFTLEVPELDIRSGEIFAILGTTGSGKTVLMETIAGAFDQDAGAIVFDGEDMRSVPVQDRGIGILYQDYALFPHMTVERNIGYGLRRAHVPKDEIARRVGAMMELFGITGLRNKHPGVISGGEAQRTALARALVLRPQLLILDEPFSALDPTTKKRMYGMLSDVHCDFDCTILFVTHDFNEAQQLADRVGIVLNGRLKTVVDAESMFEHEYDADVAAFLGLAEEDGRA